MLPNNLILGQIYPPIHHFTREQILKYLPIAKAMDTHLESDHLTVAKHAHLYHHDRYLVSKKDLSEWIRYRLDNPFKGATKLYGVIDLDTDDLIAIAFIKTTPFSSYSTIEGIYVAPSYRNKGIFKNIHNYLIKLTEVDEFRLHTVVGTKVGDTPIDTIYERLGYSHTSTFHITPIDDLFDRAKDHKVKHYPGIDLKLIATDPSPYIDHIATKAGIKHKLYKRISLMDTRLDDPYLSIKMIEDQLYSNDDIRWLTMANVYSTSKTLIAIDTMTKKLCDTLLKVVPTLKSIAYEVPVDTTPDSRILHDIIKGIPTYRKWSLTL